MKKFLIPALVLGMAVTGCKSEPKEEDTEPQETYQQDAYQSSSTDTTTKTTTSAEDSPTEIESRSMDEYLDKYESYVDEYIEVMKKVNDKDMSAMQEYPALLEKAQALDEKMKEDQDNMTKGQLKRFLKIQNKLSNAIVDMMPK